MSGAKHIPSYLSDTLLDDRSDSDASTLGGPVVTRVVAAQWAVNQPAEDGAARCYTMSVQQVTNALSEVKRRLEQKSSPDPPHYHQQRQQDQAHTLDERSDDSDWDVPVFRPTFNRHPTTTTNTTTLANHVVSLDDHTHGKAPAGSDSPVSVDYPVPVGEGHRARAATITEGTHLRQPPAPPVPAPAQLPKIPEAKIERASEQQIADYACVVDPLGEWTANTIRSMYASLMGVVPGWSPSGLALDIKNLLRRLLLAPAVVIMALYRLSTFPLKSASFTELILRQGDSRAPFKLFCLAALMTSKWLEDDSYTNRTWQEVTQIPVKDFNELECQVLSHLGYRLSISVESWNDWLARLRILHTSTPHVPPPLAPIGLPPVPDHYLFMANTISRLIAAASSSSKPLSVNSQGAVIPFEPCFLGKSARIRARELENAEEDIADMKRARLEQDGVVQQEEGVLFEEDIDLDEGGPLKEEYLPKGVREERERKERRERERELQRVREVAAAARITTSTNLPPPSEWSPENDPVVERPANNNINSGINSKRSSMTAIAPPPRSVLPTTHIHGGPPPSQVPPPSMFGTFASAHHHLYPQDFQRQEQQQQQRQQQDQYYYQYSSSLRNESRPFSQPPSNNHRHSVPASSSSSSFLYPSLAALEHHQYSTTTTTATATTTTATIKQHHPRPQSTHYLPSLPAAHAAAGLSNNNSHHRPAWIWT